MVALKNRAANTWTEGLDHMRRLSYHNTDSDEYAFPAWFSNMTAFQRWELAPIIQNIAE